MTAKLTIEYVGTDFHGWAAQPGLRTVQGELERALRTAARDPQLSLTVAGRTDRGVHALAQVASHAGEPIDCARWNALLPDDVAVLSSQGVDDGFDARHDCTSRAYRYRVLARRERSALASGRALHWAYEVDVEALEACAAALVGTHDFTAFTPSETYHVRFERDVWAAGWETGADGLLEFSIEADAFMRHMNRVLVGTMLEVARGRRSVESFVALLAGAPRSQAGPTALAHGLYFAGAGYGGERAIREAPV